MLQINAFRWILAVALLTTAAWAKDDHLLLSEVAVSPSAAEFIEIANPTSAIVSLDRYYLSDDEDYALLPGASGGGPAPSIASSDFIVQFPAGSSIPGGGVLVIAMDGAGFETTFGFKADFEIKGSDAGTPDMIATNLGATASLTDGGENAVLFFWDGASDLVSDVDMANIGTPSSTNDIGNKTGVSVDGPDAGTTPSTYATDAFTMPQQAGDPGSGKSTKRIALEGSNEVTGGGNGITGDDETTEQITTTWDAPPFSAPTPGSADFPLPLPDAASPTVTTNSFTSGPLTADMTYNDPGSGIATIEVLSLHNATVEIPKGSGDFFGQGDTFTASPPAASVNIETIATGADPSVVLKISDANGNSLFSEMNEF